MKKLTCLIVDDEPPARKIIKEFITEIDYLTLIGEAESPVEANNYLKSSKVDLLFLDIQMPGLTGIDFLKSLTDPPITIITTAYPQYALEGFEIDVLDYLVKPIRIDRFLKAVNKAKDFYDFKSKSGNIERQEFFFLKCDKRMEKIDLGSVLYIEGSGNYVTIHTKPGKYISYLTFKAVEDQLPLNQFVRIHKSYLVLIKAIQTIEGNIAKLNSGVELPISKYYKESMMDKIGGFILKR